MADEIRKETIDPETTTADAGGSPNRDPISGEPGAHPIGTGLGAAAGGAAAGVAGAAAGAALAGAGAGSMAGPIGTAVGAVVGAVAGGLAGKGIAESIDPTVEDTYWRETYAHRPYVDAGTPYEDYQPAYRYGWESRAHYPDRPYHEVESDLERGWEGAKAHSRLAWDKAKWATRDAWDRVERAMPGDADHDGR